ncbi:MAG: hypothetical protein ACD_29C00256G0001 [uncultured bacterium]|nr:MAG: hypothetical protein ACD_29C00256G0001 [uncultured bacterium]
MSILAYGINHKTAPIIVREKLAFHSDYLPNMLQNLVRESIVNEAVILSTCNRTEFYTDATKSDRLQGWLKQERLLSDLDIQSHCYTHHDQEAIRHIMRVAIGLDSMILGEPQVLGQMKQAYQLAYQAGTIGAQLKHLFPAVFEASKLIRTKTNIGAQAVSLAYIIVQLSKRIYDRLNNCRVLLIGAGETINLVATYLHQQNVKEMTIANRSIEKAMQIAEPIQARTIAMRDIPIVLKESDIVISATTSQLPILGKGMIETALKQKKQRPLFLVDLAVPRDIEAEVATLNNVYLYNIDDLQKMISDHFKNRQDAAKLAEEMIDWQVTCFLRRMKLLGAQNIIVDYRKKLENLSQQELQKAQIQLQHGTDPALVLEQFRHNLIKKITHHPTIQLRKAAENTEFELIALAKKLFLLE